jgi:hypothetical protein
MQITLMWTGKLTWALQFLQNSSKIIMNLTFGTVVFTK